MYQNGTALTVNKELTCTKKAVQQFGMTWPPHDVQEIARQVNMQAREVILINPINANNIEMQWSHKFNAWMTREAWQRIGQLFVIQIHPAPVQHEFAGTIRI